MAKKADASSPEKAIDLTYPFKEKEKGFKLPKMYCLADDVCIFLYFVLILLLNRYEL